MTDNKTPEIVMYFTMGFVGMDDHVEEHFVIPITADQTAFEKTMAIRGQLAQLKLQTSFAELMLTQFPQFLEAKAAAEGWEVPPNFKM
ncbi:hypothetical protein SEA_PAULODIABOLI_203 [Microbacterium phage PauloDiaboli]|nr:hypothetical protein SEA_PAULODIABOLI_203 [Microbacterium phage PauloDiaboli]